MTQTIREQAAALNMNPWVVAWARTRAIDPAFIVHRPGDDRFRIDGIPWTIIYTQWMDKQWETWRSWCPSSGIRPDDCLCYDTEKFTAWLCDGKAPDRWRCPECDTLNGHTAKCLRHSEHGPASPLKTRI